MYRLDVFLARSGLAPSREKAKSLILEGAVTVNGAVVKRCSRPVSENDDIKLSKSENYVGRGAYKLIKALETFHIDVNGRVCADIGASTGGFTQTLLQNGASCVYAVDVGHGQLAQTLADDPRVRNIEGTNVKEIRPGFFDKRVGLFCCDLSFISLKQALPPLYEAAEIGAEFVLLIKPQFEAGRASLNKRGVVTDRKAHIRVLSELTEFFAGLSLSVMGIDFSPIIGGSGNIEYLTYLIKEENAAGKVFDIKSIVGSAFEQLKDGARS